METLAEKGLPRYQNAWEKVASVEQTGERSVRFAFSGADSELPLIIGLRPILKKADWEGVDFAASSLRVPVGSGPYAIGAFEPGRFIELRARTRTTGAAICRSTAGCTTSTPSATSTSSTRGVLFQAFTAGELSVYRELSPARWASDYDFPGGRLRARS